jgi:hypothetical protein
MTSLKAKDVDARYSTFNDFAGDQISYVSVTQNTHVHGDARQLFQLAAAS